MKIVGGWGGCDDELSPGTIFHLNEMALLGEVHYFLVHDDVFIENKGRNPKYSQHIRRINVEATQFVTQAISLPNGFEEEIQTIVNYQPKIDIWCFGQEQDNVYDKILSNRLRNTGIEIVHIPRLYKESTTQRPGLSIDEHIQIQYKAMVLNFQTVKLDREKYAEQNKWPYLINASLEEHLMRDLLDLPVRIITDTEDLVINVSVSPKKTTLSGIRPYQEIILTPENGQISNVEKLAHGPTAVQLDTIQVSPDKVAYGNFKAQNLAIIIYFRP